MNNFYYFHLGQNPKLSHWEIETILPELKLKFDETHSMVSGFVNTVSPQDLQTILGGTVKISEHIHSGEMIGADLLAEIIRQKFKSGAKITLGLSQSKRDLFDLKDLALTTKRLLQTDKINVRFVTPADNFQLNSASIIHNNLIDNPVALEINILAGRKQAYNLTQTVACQNIDDYSLRDYDRPTVRLKAGLMPPKLAKMLVNIGGMKSGQLYDPFCGDGTILQEGLLKSFTVIGSDLAPAAVRSTRENLNWLKDNYGLTTKIEVFQADVTTLPETVACDLIVTEGDLGTPRTQAITLEQAEGFYGNRKEFHEQVFYSLSTKTTASKLIICFPAFQLETGDIFVPEMSWFQSITTNSSFKPSPYNKNEPFVIYKRTDQNVGRLVTAWNRI